MQLYIPSRQGPEPPGMKKASFSGSLFSMSLSISPVVIAHGRHSLPVVNRLPFMSASSSAMGMTSEG